MLNIPLPPFPILNSIQILVASLLCIFAGGVLLVLGRHYGRAMLCVVGMLAGLWIGGLFGDHIPLAPWLARLLTAVVLGVVGLTLARFVWAIMAGSVFGSIAAWILLSTYLPSVAASNQPVFEEVGMGFIGGLGGVVEYGFGGLVAIWPGNQLLICLTVLPAAVIPIAVSSAHARLGKVLMSAIAGAMFVFAGLVLGLGRMSYPAWDWCWAHLYMLAVPAGLLAVGGTYWQFHHAIKADRAKKLAAAEAEDEIDESQSAKKADKRLRKGK